MHWLGLGLRLGLELDATFYQSALRHEQHEDVTPSVRPFWRGFQREFTSEFTRFQREFALIYWLNDVSRARLSQPVLLFLIRYVKVCKFGTASLVEF